VKLTCIPHARLPPLAWCARLDQRGSAVVHHGLRVETRSEGFVEGAWDGAFEAFDFDRAETAAATGGRVRDGRLVFVSPSNPLERLFVLRLAGTTMISNSLVFVLAAAGDALDPSYPRYFFDLLAQARKGIATPPARLPTAAGHVVEAFVCCNLEVLDAARLRRVDKPLGPPPRSFGEYFRMIQGAAIGVAANAASTARRHVYPMVAACSKGYDSTAAAALASRAGCREGVTFTASAAASGHPLLGVSRESLNDSGASVLQALGMQVTEFDRTAVDGLPDHPHAEFFIGPAAMTDASTRAMEDSLRGRVLVSGRHGERYWGLRRKCARRNLRETDDCLLSGHTLGEFRLRAGFVHFPVPYVGARHGPAIHAITCSDEMRPWRLGSGYDRPIARRIAEEAGVPRETFGRRKMGAGSASRRLGPESERDFLDFVKTFVPERVRRGLDPRPIDERRRGHDRLAYVRTNYSHLPGADALLDLVGADRLHVLWNSVYLYRFHWGAAKIAHRYTLV
jgi:hypothetical protein